MINKIIRFEQQYFIFTDFRSIFLTRSSIPDQSSRCSSDWLNNWLIVKVYWAFVVSIFVPPSYIKYICMHCAPMSENHNVLADSRQIFKLLESISFDYDTNSATQPSTIFALQTNWMNLNNNRLYFYYSKRKLASVQMNMQWD